MSELVRHKPDDTYPVGRDHEHNVLLSAFRATCSGSGRLFLIGGEAGIGKTTVVEHFAAEARAAAANVLVGASYDVASSPAFAPWKELLATSADHGASILDRLTDRTRSELPDQATLFSSVLGRLERESRSTPLVLVLEDIHWSDHESLELLRFVARSARDMPVMIIATYRNDEIAPGHPLFMQLPNLVRESRAERIELRPFPPETVADLVLRNYRLIEREHLLLVDELSRRTDGNPFFISELLRSMETAGILYRQAGEWRLAPLTDLEIPPLVRQVIERRLYGLDDSARHALQIAAVVGIEVQPDLWLSLVNEDETGLSAIVQQALDASVLEQSPYRTSLRFRHALVRDALYSSLPLPWRQMQHRRIATVLAEEPGTDPAVVATHLLSASDDRAVSWLMEAARQARRLYATDAVIRHINAAFEAPYALTQVQRVEALMLNGWARDITGDFDGANRDYLNALFTARQSGAEQAEWDALILLGELWAGRDYRRSGEYLDQALQLAENMGDQRLIAYSLNRTGNWHMNQENPDRAQDLHFRALSMYEAAGDHSGIAETEDLLGITAVMAGDLSKSARHYQRAIALFESMDKRVGLSSSLANYSHRGPIYPTDTMVPAPASLDECAADVERAVAIAREIDFRAGEAYALVRLAAVHGPRGDYQRALDALVTSISIAAEIEHQQWLTAAHTVGGSLYLDLVDPDTAISHLQRALSIANEIGSRAWIQSSSGLLAMAHLVAGNPDASWERLKVSWSPDLPARTIAQRQVWCAYVELTIERQDHARAVELIDWLLETTPRASREHPALRLSLMRSRVLIALEQYADAESWLLPALASTREYGARSLQWRILRELGRSRYLMGRRVDANEDYDRAHEIIIENSATLQDESMRSAYLTAAHGLVPRGTAPTLLQLAKTTSGGLTRRQREVAALIASGFSNREIANDLSISERTVETHVTAILSTLSMTSRSQIAAWYVEHDFKPIESE